MLIHGFSGQLAGCVILIVHIFNSMLLMDLINNVPPGRLAKQKMMTISDIVHSQLFLDPECRLVLLPVIMARIRDMLELHDEVSGFYRFICLIIKLQF